MLLNIGGVSNVSVYVPTCSDANEDGRFIGFDCGPGTYMLMISVYECVSRRVCVCVWVGGYHAVSVSVSVCVRVCIVEIHVCQQQ